MTRLGIISLLGITLTIDDDKTGSKCPWNEPDVEAARVDVYDIVSGMSVYVVVSIMNGLCLEVSVRLVRLVTTTRRHLMKNKDMCVVCEAVGDTPLRGVCPQ